MKTQHFWLPTLQNWRVHPAKIQYFCKAHLWKSHFCQVHLWKPSMSSKIWTSAVNFYQGGKKIWVTDNYPESEDHPPTHPPSPVSADNFATWRSDKFFSPQFLARVQFFCSAQVPPSLLLSLRVLSVNCTTKPIRMRLNSALAVLVQCSQSYTHIHIWITPQKQFEDNIWTEQYILHE